MQPNRPVGAHTGFEGFPGADNPLVNILYAQLGQHMRSSGFSPMGLNQQNLLDQARNAQFMKMHNSMLQESAALDSENYMRTMQGIARATGAKFGAEERANTQKMIQGILPFAAPLAGTAGGSAALEFLGGDRGSNIVMAQRLIMGSRFRFDPISGQVGMGRESIRASIAQMAEMVNRDDVTGLQGFGAGGLGDMSQFLQSRGLLPSMAGSGARRAALQTMGGVSGEDFLGRAMDRTGIGAGRSIDSLSRSDIGSLSSDPEVAQRMRNFDGAKVARVSKDYLEAARAMGDLIGDPNAPIPQLMAALEQMVGPGALAQMSPQRVASMVRNTREMATLTGVSPAAVMAMNQHIANQANAMGIDSSVFGQPILQDALAFRQGMNFTPAYGRMSADRGASLHAQLSLGAVKSRAANRMGAFMRMRAAMGGSFEDAEAERLALQVETDTLTSAPDQAAIQKMFGRMGISASQTNQFMAQTFANREFVSTHNLGRQIARLQPEEIRGGMARITSGVLARRLGMSSTAVQGMSKRVVSAAMGMAEADFADMGKRDEVIQASINAEMDRMGIGPNDPRRAEITGRLSSEITGEWDRRAYKLKSGARNAQELYQVVSDDARELADRATVQSRTRSVIASGLGGLGQGSFGRRLIASIQDSKTGEIDDILMRTLGVDHKKITKAAAGGFQELGQQAAEIRNLENQLFKEKDPETRKEIVARIQEKKDAMEASTAGVIKSLKDAGISVKGLDAAADKQIKEEEAKAAKKAEEVNEHGAIATGAKGVKGKEGEKGDAGGGDGGGEIVIRGELTLKGNTATLRGTGSKHDAQNVN
jgi:hypothetical protein